MSPTIVMNAEGKPIISIGAAGGPTIISQAVLGIINRIDLNLPLEQCLSSPRFHHQWRPDALQIENSLAPEIQAELKRRGHVLRSTGDIGVTQAISQDPNGGFEGMAEPRGIGSAGGR